MTTINEGQSSFSPLSSQLPRTVPESSGADFSARLNAFQGATDQLSLSSEAQKELSRLQKRDQEVRRHEEAHKAAGGPYAGGIHYETEQGPDGQQYAVGGSVPIDTSPVPGDPEATIQKAEQIQRAANAPADPSAEDRQVAAKASSLKTDAEREKAQEAEREESDASNTESFVAGTIAGQDTEPTRPSVITWANGTYHAGRQRNATFAMAPGTPNSLYDNVSLDSRMPHASKTYAVMARQGVMPTSLAPNGTGISLQI